MPLAIQPKLCTGCRLCMLACAAVKKGFFNPLEGRLFVEQCYTYEGLTLTGKVCNLCLACRDNCPNGAIIFNGAYLELYDEHCNGCGACVEACPERVLRLDKSGRPMLCDLCKGNPQCVLWCPTGALQEEGRDNVRLPR